MGAGKSLKMAKKIRAKKSGIFFARFRLFPAPTNCPWVSKDDCELNIVKKASVQRPTLIKRRRPSCRHKDDFVLVYTFIKRPGRFEVGRF